jgi:hypothetical protein
VNYSKGWADECMLNVEWCMFLVSCVRHGFGVMSKAANMPIVSLNI